MMSAQNTTTIERNKRCLEIHRRLLDDFRDCKTSELMYARANAWAAYIERQETEAADLAILRAHVSELERELREVENVVMPFAEHGVMAPFYAYQNAAAWLQRRALRQKG